VLKEIESAKSNKKLSQVISTAAAIGEECEIASSLNRGVPAAVLNSLRWHPPAFPQRVFVVFSSGWSGLNSPRSIAQRVQFLSSASETDMTDRREESLRSHYAT
jgi:hypothetical protein